MSKTDSEPDERLSEEELVARVTLLAPGIILMREVPSPTLTTVHQMFRRVENLLGDEPLHALIGDLRQSSLAGAEVRAKIRGELEKHRCRRMGMVFPENRLFQVAAKFLVAATSSDALIFDSPEEALAAFLDD
jgi:hypothetical protein